jgi:hypothetical protein
MATASVLRVNGARAFANGALFLAGSFAAWAAFAVADVAFDSAVSSAFRAVFHFCVVIGAGFSSGGEYVNSGLWVAEKLVDDGELNVESGMGQRARE